MYELNLDFLFNYTKRKIMLIDDKYEITFHFFTKKKKMEVAIVLPITLVWKLGDGINDQILANFNGYVNDNILVF